MNRRIRLEDINGRQIGDFEEIAAGDWRGVDFERSAGISIYRWENIITRIADLIGSGHVYRISGALAKPVPLAEIDRAGNTWLDHEYLAPHQYLPLLVPEISP